MNPTSERKRVKNGFDWRDFDAYLFDIDGTLLNSRGRVHYHSFTAAMRDVYGVEGTIDGVAWHGNTDVGILRAALAKLGVDDYAFAAKREQALSVMRRELENNASRVEAELCPAISTLLKELDSNEKLLGVSSGNLEVIGWVKLRAASIAQYFKFGSFSDLNDTRVEIFRHGATLAQIYGKRGEATRICFIGDTPSDIDAAHKLGLPVIAVATGIHKFDELAGHEPEMCLTCCEDLYPRS
jgi:phosphoglycolate phosphatase-like HAD superfamily hydrolase